MTLEEILEIINRAVQSGRLNLDEPVKFRNFSISEYAMEAGSDGYIEVDEVLIVDGSVLLLADNES
jgi:hypothetical protein